MRREYIFLAWIVLAWFIVSVPGIVYYLGGSQ